MSAGNLPVPLVEHLRLSAHAPAVQGGGKRAKVRKPQVPVDVAARDLGQADTKGYLQVLEETLQWNK